MAGVTISANVCANLIVFVAFIAFADRTLEWFGDQVGVQDFTLSVSYFLLSLLVAVVVVGVVMW